MEILIRGKFSICVSTDILEEYEEILAQFYSDNTSKWVIKTLENLPNVYYITKYYRWNLIYQDPDDNKFVDSALFCGSGYIVTHDKHFNVLKNIDFPTLNIIDIDTFGNYLTNR